MSCSLRRLFAHVTVRGHLRAGLHGLRAAIGQKRLRGLCAKLEELSEDRCRQLLQALVRSCELVAGGEEAVKEDLACIKVVSRPLSLPVCSAYSQYEHILPGMSCVDLPKDDIVEAQASGEM